MKESKVLRKKKTRFFIIAKEKARLYNEREQGKERKQGSSAKERKFVNNEGGSIASRRQGEVLTILYYFKARMFKVDIQQHEEGRRNILFQDDFEGD